MGGKRSSSKPLKSVLACARPLSGGPTGGGLAGEIRNRRSLASDGLQTIRCRRAGGLAGIILSMATRCFIVSRRSALPLLPAAVQERSVRRGRLERSSSSGTLAARSRLRCRLRSSRPGSSCLRGSRPRVSTTRAMRMLEVDSGHHTLRAGGADMGTCGPYRVSFRPFARARVVSRKSMVYSLGVQRGDATAVIGGDQWRGASDR
jgi:hypothetical protein